MNKKIIFVSLSLAFIFFTACEKRQEELTADNANITKAAAEGKLSLQDPWIRIAGKSMNTALFVKIVNNTNLNDTLLSVDSDVAELIEIHETYRRENDMMGMRQVDFVEIPAGDTVELKPMSLHVMCIGLKEDLSIGDSVKATMHFKINQPIEIVGVVKELNMNPPAKDE